jgi:hypothetical protein
MDDCGREKNRHAFLRPGGVRFSRQEVDECRQKTTVRKQLNKEAVGERRGRKSWCAILWGAGLKTCDLRMQLHKREREKKSNEKDETEHAGVWYKER